VTLSDYVVLVLDAYTDLPDTPQRPSRSDRALARCLHQQNVPLSLIQHAMLLATVRRQYRDPALPPLEPIHSLHYFLPVIRQIMATPLEPTYVEYLQRKIDDIRATSNSVV
jgi:hypothetical protein